MNKDHSEATASAIDRRRFLKQLGAGLIVVVAWHELDLAGAEETAPVRAGRRLPTDFNAFLRIGEDGRVTCFTGKIEMGQGAITSLPQMLADELGAPLASVDMVMGDTELCPWDAGTWGSMTTRGFGPALRAAAAEARAVLIELAAEALQVPATQLQVQEGIIRDGRDPARQVSFARLTKGQRIERHLRAKPTLKDVAEFSVMGKPQLRRDAREKVTGAAKYTGDLRRPGMLYARLLRPPAHGAVRKGVDVSAAKALPGVLVVEEGDLIAVLHERPDLAEAALEKVQADFARTPTGVNDGNIHEHLLRVATAPRVIKQEGDLAVGRKAAQQTVTATYLDSYFAHAPIEPHTALAVFEDGKLTVWASTQTPFGAQAEIAQALGLEPARVRVIAPYLGGAFGGKSANGQAIEAARLAKITGRPVQVAWTREEEFFNDTFRPAAVVGIDAGLDAKGQVTFWDYDVAYAGDRGAAHFYAFPHHRTSTRGAARGGPQGHPFATGAWRAPGNSSNTFARECHLDALAIAAAVDPVEFRLRHLTDPRMIRVLKAAAERFGYRPGVGPTKRGIGVACGIDAGTYVTAIAEVTVNPNTGAVRVKRVVCAQDMGIVVNPAGAILQMEGCITMGLGYALTEQLRFADGELHDTNFGTYELPRFSVVPKMETVLVKNDELAPQGGGEPAIVVMGAVLANAIHDATGVRLRQMPMTPDRIRAALGGAAAVGT